MEASADGCRAFAAWCCRRVRSVLLMTVTRMVTSIVPAARQVLMNSVCVAFCAEAERNSCHPAYGWRKNISIQGEKYAAYNPPCKKSIGIFAQQPLRCCALGRCSARGGGKNILFHVFFQKKLILRVDKSGKKEYDISRTLKQQSWYGSKNHVEALMREACRKTGLYLCSLVCTISSVGRAPDS